jgi:hypothetical protein
MGRRLTGVTDETGHTTKEVYKAMFLPCEFTKIVEVEEEGKRTTHLTSE